MEDPFLAIVVPAYRESFLKDALITIKNQTDQDFNLYVFDDGSPYDLRSVFQSVFPESQSNRTFFRFASNLGRKELVENWNRCVRATCQEPWIWLFSDDDVMDSHCVETAREIIQENFSRHSVFRFNTKMINAAGEFVQLNIPHPQYEPPIAFAYFRLRGERHSYAPDYIFARSSFNGHSGFVNFPAAWGSDDASWIEFSENRSIVTIPNAFVCWRSTSGNVSGSNEAREDKVEGAIQFLEWLFKWSSESAHAIEGVDRHGLFLNAPSWLHSQLDFLKWPIGWKRSHRLAERLRPLFGWNEKRFFCFILVQNVRLSRSIAARMLKQLLNRKERFDIFGKR